MRLVVCLLLVSSISSSALWAASFDCAKAEDEAERAVCASAEISKTTPMPWPSCRGRTRS